LLEEEPLFSANDVIGNENANIKAKTSVSKKYFLMITSVILLMIVL